MSYYGKLYLFMKRITGKCATAAGQQESIPPASGETDRTHDTVAGVTATDALTRRLSAELFARLLLELPEHRQALVAAYRDHQIETLANCNHKLLGAVIYCDLPELGAALQDLRQALGSDDAGALRRCHGIAIRAIDDVLGNSGYR